MSSSASNSTILLFLLLTSSFLHQPSSSSPSQDGSMEMRPMALSENKPVMFLNGTRRRLGSFRICSLCTCCGGPRGLCLPSPCCYAINCNIPNRPFGFCSFTPKACNCFGCHI